MDLPSTDSSSDEDFGFSPLAQLAKHHQKSSQKNKPQCSVVNLPRSFKNLAIHDGSNSPTDDNIKNNKSVNVSDTPVLVNDDKNRTRLSEENNEFHPQVVLASKPCEEGIKESSMSWETLSLRSVSDSQKCSDEKTESGESRKQSVGSPRTESHVEQEAPSFSETVTKLEDRSSDDDENICSPLNALADKFKKVKVINSSSPVQDDSCNIMPTTSVSKQGSQLNDRSYSSPFLNVGDDINSVCSCEVQDTEECNSLHKCRKNQIDVMKAAGSFKETETRISSKESSDISLNKMSTELSGVDLDMSHKSVSSLSDLAFFHLTKSSSCGENTSFDAHQQIHSDSNISRSFPGGFVIPFLRPERQAEVSQTDTKDYNVEVTSDAEMDSADEWIIDLSGAIRDPSLSLPFVAQEKPKAHIISIPSAEVEDVMVKKEDDTFVTSERNANEMLKMKFSYTKRKCSSLGKIICRQWRHLARPYIPPSKPNNATIDPFAFNTKSPDDLIIYHLRRSK